MFSFSAGLSEVRTAGFDEGNGMSLGPVLFDKENSGATHNPGTSVRFCLLAIDEAEVDEVSGSRVASQ